MWSIIEERKSSIDGILYTAYGIKGKTTIIHDICTDRKDIEKLAELMNRYNASEINAADIVEDFIAAR